MCLKLPTVVPERFPKAEPFNYHFTHACCKLRGAVGRSLGLSVWALSSNPVGPKPCLAAGKTLSSAIVIILFFVFAESGSDVVDIDIDIDVDIRAVDIGTSMSTAKSSWSKTKVWRRSSGRFMRMIV